MLIEALQLLLVRLSAGVVELVPVELPDEQGRRLLAKVPEKVRRITDGCPVIEPAALHARPVYWEGVDGKLHEPARPEFLAQADRHFWVIVTFRKQSRWIRSDRLRAKPQ